MVYKTLTRQITNRVLVACIHSPVNNEEDIARLSDELTELCTEAVASEGVRVVVITGNHKKSFSVEPVYKTGENHPEHYHPLAAPVATLDLPAIAAINSDALGQGLELALACDIRIAAETSRFGLTHIRTGVIPRDGGTQRLARIVGRAKAAEMIFTGETIDATEALRIGLVHRVVPSSELMTAAMLMASEMAAKSPLALRSVKEAVYKGMDLTLEQGLRLEADLYFLLHTSGDRTEGITAFREKRKPEFEGR